VLWVSWPFLLAFWFKRILCTKVFFDLQWKFRTFLSGDMYRFDATHKYIDCYLGAKIIYFLRSAGSFWVWGCRF
jgi:hypothetical protein